MNKDTVKIILQLQPHADLKEEIAKLHQINDELTRQNNEVLKAEIEKEIGKNQRTLDERFT